MVNIISDFEIIINENKQYILHILNNFIFIKDINFIIIKYSAEIATVKCAETNDSVSMLHTQSLYININEYLFFIEFIMTPGEDEIENVPEFITICLLTDCLKIITYKNLFIYYTNYYLGPRFLHEFLNHHKNDTMNVHINSILHNDIYFFSHITRKINVNMEDYEHYEGIRNNNKEIIIAVKNPAELLKIIKILQISLKKMGLINDNQ